MAQYHLTLEQLQNVIAAIPTARRRDGYSFAWDEGSTTIGVLTTNSTADAFIAPIVAAVMDGATPPQLPSELHAYADKKLAEYWIGEINVNVGSEEAPQVLAVDVSSKGQTFVAGLLLDVTLGSEGETWFQNGGSVSITADQVRIVGRALKAYVQTAMSVWQRTDSGITNGSIITTSQIDALPWPATAG